VGNDLSDFELTLKSARGAPWDVSPGHDISGTGWRLQETKELPKQELKNVNISHHPSKCWFPSIKKKGTHTVRIPQTKTNKALENGHRNSGFSH
jgi:hypothetical protein